MEFIISHTDDVLVSHAGLALAGALLGRTALQSRLDAMAVEGFKRPAMPHGKQIYTGETWRERDDRLQRVIFQVVNAPSPPTASGCSCRRSTLRRGGRAWGRVRRRPMG
ncbi:MAG: hypothetical protein IH587_05350 [Anaerolineae bacterium]|nr:hypothetical protein [Anaerolineae bacterium]